MIFRSGQKIDTNNSVLLINIDIILPNPDQPRRDFSYDELEGLAQSIRNSGIIQPLSVRKVNDDKFVLISGERRLRAAKMAGLSCVPCIQLAVSDYESALLSILENVQREDLNFFEQAYAIEKLISVYNMSQDEISRKLGLSRSALSNKLRLLRLNDFIKSKIVNNSLTERHARALLRLDSDEIRCEVLNYIISKNLNVAQSEFYINKILDDKNKVSRSEPKFKKLKDLRIFVNTINHAIETMRQAGIEADSSEHETQSYYEYVVRIPKTPSPVKIADFSKDAV